jgi:hypothetical protein
VPNLKADRTAALLCGDYDAVNGFDADIRKAEFDSERRELEIEQTHRALERAQAGDHAVEVDRRVAAAQAKSKEMPEALAELERAYDLVREKLATVDQINDAVDQCNALLPADQQLPNPEWLYRGGSPGENRQEVKRVNLGDRWFYLDSGAPVHTEKHEFTEGDRRPAGDINVDPNNPYRGVQIFDRDAGAMRVAQVLKRRVTKVIYDEARSPFTFARLADETFLPSIMMSDNRAPRGTFEQVVIEDIEAAPVKSEAAA